jgi:hypothetical protein
MIRIVLQELSLFLTPFLLWALLLALKRRRILDPQHWSGVTMTLAIAGFVLAIGGLLAFGLFGERHQGAYVPPHMENGRLVPGEFR